MLIGSASAFAQTSPNPNFTATPLTPSDQTSLAIAKDNTAQPQAARGAAPASKRMGVIVKLKDASLASYTGNVPGLAATSPAVTGAEAIDTQSPASKQYLGYLDAQQDAFVASAKQAIPSATSTHRLDVIVNAVAMQVPSDQVDALSKLPGVVAVYPDTLQHIDTDASPAFIGATSLYPKLGGAPNAGKGVIFGTLDTGVWPEHPSFADNGNLGAPPAKADGTPRVCDFGDNPLTPATDPFVCNNKLIGGQGFLDTYNAVQPTEMYGYTARDSDGHGTHTASTAAGDPVASAPVLGVDRGPLNGIAPGAWISVYKVCGAAGCYQSDSVAAIQQAIKDGVKVINFSISGGANAYSDAVELAFLDAYAAGVFVAASAGNSGPTPETTDHRGPWVTTVAASTQARAFESTLTLNASDGATATFKGASITAGISSPLPVVLASAAPYSNALCTAPAPAGLFAGKIVACQRGSNARVDKGFNVKQGGAAGMILYNPTLADVETDNHWLPAVHLADGTQFLAFVNGHPGVTASFTAGAKVTGQGDVMAAFSSRGGPAQTLGISKPDITAPGVQILAGNTPTPDSTTLGPPGQYFQAIAGTSMSSPHIAGSALLLKALRPGWTPGQIKSALMTTAWTKVVKEDGVTPANAFDYGSGRVNLNVAGDPGFTFDATGADYIAHQNDLWNANYPSVYVPVMPGIITVKRTAREITGNNSFYKVIVSAPSDVKISTIKELDLYARQPKSFDITIDASNVPIGQVRFAMLTFRQLYDSNSHRELHVPITIVRKAPVVTLAKTCDPASFPKGSTTTCTITAQNSTFNNANVSITDKLPNQLKLVKNSVTGGTAAGNTVSFNGMLAGAQPPLVSIGSGSSPAGGYLPLSLFGITPIAGVGDETITNFNVPTFLYGGQLYSRIGVVSDGYAVVGGGTSADVNFLNQNLPNPAAPNNVLAPFWTDLNPGAAGSMRIGVLTDGTSSWIVVDWAGVKEYSTAKTNDFEIWIGVNGVEDISYAYGTLQGNGEGGLLTVGAENFVGLGAANSGNYYYNGTGTLPTMTTELQVTTVPGVPGETRTISFKATGAKAGSWTNYAKMTSDLFQGTNVAPFSGTVTP